MLADHSHERITPLLPSVQNVIDNPNDFLTDHIQFMVKVSGLNIGTGNLTGASAYSGCHHIREWETTAKTDDIAKPGTTLRYERSIDAWIEAIKNCGLDVLCFQEASYEYILPVLQEKLGAEWDIHAEQRLGMCILSRKTKFEPIAGDVYRYDEPTRTQTLALTDKETYKLYIINNVWTPFKHFPDSHEALYKKMMKEGVDLGNKIISMNSTKKISNNFDVVIVGDMNNGFAPINNRPRNIVSNTVPPCMNEEAFGSTDSFFVRGDMADGGFLLNSKKQQIHQLTLLPLDMQDGKPYDMTELEKPEWLHVLKTEKPEDQPNYQLPAKMILCLDQHYQDTPIIDGKTIFTYEEMMQKVLEDELILIRVAKNLCNEPCIAFRFHPESLYYALFKEKFQDDITLRFVKGEMTMHDQSGLICPVLFVPEDKLELVVQTVNQIAQQKKSLSKIYNLILKAIEHCRHSIFTVDAINDRKWVAWSALYFDLFNFIVNESIKNNKTELTNDEILALIANWEKQPADKNEYNLALMSLLSDGNKNNTEKGKIYLSGDGEYVLLDPQGTVKEGKFDTGLIGSDRLDAKLKNEQFKEAILEITSAAGHLPTNAQLMACHSNALGLTFFTASSKNELDEIKRTLGFAPGQLQFAKK